MTLTLDIPTAEKTADFEANLTPLLRHMYAPFRGLLAAFSPDGRELYIVAEDLPELLRRLRVHNIPTETVVIERVPGDRPPQDNPWPDMKINLVKFRRNQEQVTAEDLVPNWGKQVAWHGDGTHIVASADTTGGVYERLRELGIDPPTVVFDFIEDPNRVYF